MKRRLLVVVAMIAMATSVVTASPGMNVPRRAHERHRDETIVLTDRGTRTDAEYCTLLGRIEQKDGFLTLIPANRAVRTSVVFQGHVTVEIDGKLRHGRLYGHTRVVWRGGVVSKVDAATLFVHDQAAADLWTRRLESQRKAARYYNAYNWARTHRQP